MDFLSIRVISNFLLLLEIIAIAKPASIGSHENIPTLIKDTNAPPTIGINQVLYANAEKEILLYLRYCFSS